MNKSNVSEFNLSGFEIEILKKYGSYFTEEENGLIANKNIFLWVKYLLLNPIALVNNQRPTKTILLRKTIDYDYEDFPEFCFGLLEIELMKRYLLEKQIKERRFYIIGYRKTKFTNKETNKTLNQIEIFYLAFYQTPVNFLLFIAGFNYTYSVNAINEVFNTISDYLDDLNGNYHHFSNSKYGCFMIKETPEDCKVFCEVEYVNDQIDGIFYTTFKEINALILKSEIEKKELSWMTICLGRLSCTIKDFENAMVEFTKALSLRNLLYGEIHQEVADAMEKIGTVKMNLRKNEESMNLFKQVYEIRVKCLSEDDTRISDALYNIGTAHLQLKNYSAGREYFEISLSLLEKIKKKNEITSYIDLKIANSLVGLAYCFQETNDWKKILEHLLQALKINLSYFDYVNAKTSFLIERISHVYKNLKEEVKAFEYGVRAYQSFLKLFGKNKKTEESLVFLRNLQSSQKIKRLMLIVCNLRSQMKKVYKRKLIIEEIFQKFI